MWQAPIDLLSGGKLADDAGDLEEIMGPRDPGNPEWMIGGIEGPFVLKRDGAYWMFFLRLDARLRDWRAAWAHTFGSMGANAQQPPILGTRKRRYREKQMEEGGYSHLRFADTDDPFVEVGHCAVFEGPDGADWLCCHYFLEGRKPIEGSIPEYRDTAPQLGIEPIRLHAGEWHVDGPTWTQRRIAW